MAGMILPAWGYREWRVGSALVIRQTKIRRLTSKVQGAWKILRFSGSASAEDYTTELERLGYQVSDWARAIMQTGPDHFRANCVDLLLGNLSVKELGFPGGATYRNVCSRAHERGWQLCEPVVGAVVRLIYDDQPNGERLRIAIRSATSNAKNAILTVDKS